MKIMKKDRRKIKISGKNVSKKIVQELDETRKEITEKLITLILGGVGLVAALAWNEAIATLFENLLKTTGEVVGKFIYAVIVTVILAIISLNLQKVLEKALREKRG